MNTTQENQDENTQELPLDDGNGKIGLGDHYLNLIVVWNNIKEQKIVRYELHVGKCHGMEAYRIKTGNHIGEVVMLPRCSTVISGLKITKKQAKDLMAKGYTISAAYYLVD